MTIEPGGYRPQTFIDKAPLPEWTPEAVDAAGGSMEPLTAAERRLATAYAGPYKLAGKEPNPNSPDVARVMEVVVRRDLQFRILPGLVIETESTSDRWYICFRKVRKYRQDVHVFHEASGGEHELFTEDEFEGFLKRFDIKTRMARMETRNGFRVVVYEAPSA